MELADLTPVAEAQALFSAAVPPKLPATVELSVSQVLGRVLAETVVSEVDVPGFSRSTVDGYAVRARDTFGASAGAPAYLDLQGEVEMGEAAESELRAAQTVAVATGAMLPPEANAVVMVEYTDRTPDGQVEIRRPVAPFENVIQQGEDIRRGKKLLRCGKRLRPQDMGALAGIGRTSLKVFERPRAAVISTGDELIPPDFEPGLGEIRDINTYSLSGLVEQDGGIPLPMGIVQDRPELLLAALEKALDAADMVLISGGSSVGTRDIVAQVVNSLGEPGVLVHGVTLRPGKPTILGVVREKPVYGMPGHPVSAMVVYRLFVRPLLRRLMGCSLELPPEGYIEATLTRNVRSTDGRTEYVRVRLQQKETETLAAPVLGASGLISTMSRAEGFVVIPLGSDGIEAGTWVKVYLFEGL